jgi:hypoxanthine-guanine phosphoribosyltransferase
MNQNQYIGEMVLDEVQIQDGVKIVAQKLNQQFTQAVVITVVPGGILFTADLVRQLSFDITYRVRIHQVIETIARKLFITKTLRFLGEM